MGGGRIVHVRYGEPADGGERFRGWSRSYGYDAFGNMWVNASGSAGVPIAGNTPTSNVFNAKNQIGLNYDLAGNQTVVNGNTSGYDAENRQVTVSDSVTQAATCYAYDGNGNRVAKGLLQNTNVCAPAIVYVYDMAGLAAEYSADGAASSACTTCYLSWDHLGSTRLVTDQNANVVARHDYLPFGEEIAANTAGRLAEWGAGSDNINQKFTGKERDSESGLDYFGARYYGSALGRFSSPDFGGPMPNQPDPVPWADLENPQSLNLYAYGLNGPLSNVDDDGHDVNVCTNDENGNEHCRQISNEEYQQAQQGNNVGLNVPTLNQVGMNGDGNGKPTHEWLVLAEAVQK
jgi:RHS repeat-associated protein